MSSVSVAMSSLLFGLSYLLAEMIFYVVFRYYFIPKANEISEPSPYRDYGKERFALLLKIMNRIFDAAKKDSGNAQVSRDEGNKIIHDFLLSWFQRQRQQQIQQQKQQIGAKDIASFNVDDATSVSSSSSSSNSSVDESTTAALASTSSSSTHSCSSSQQEDSSSSSSSPSSSASSSPPRLFKEDVDDFFAWAFFGKYYSNLLDWEHQEMNKMYDKLSTYITFPKRPSNMTSSSYKMVPCRLTLDPISNAIHRPFLVYCIFIFLKILVGWILRIIFGFQRIEAKNGVVGWYRKQKLQKQQKTNIANNATTSISLSPVLFFHGIAPGGIVFYLPMVLYGLFRHAESDLILFENPSISYTPKFRAHSEQDTVDGVVEILQRKYPHTYQHQQYTLAGHSFGSCPITWLLAANHPAIAIDQVILLDPVTILLSNPDVLVNFLYSNIMGKIQMVASSELFTEYYLRRHFSWYNAELWIADMCRNQKVLVAISEKDEIINAYKVKKEVESHQSNNNNMTKNNNNIDLLYWEQVGHAACVTCPPKWSQIRSHYLQQQYELRIQKQQQYKKQLPHYF